MTRIDTHIAGRHITLTRPTGQTHGWDVKIGHHRAGRLDWNNDQDRTWHIDLSDDARRYLGFPTTRRRFVLARGITRDEAIRVLLLHYGWGNDVEADRISANDEDAHTTLFHQALEAGHTHDDDIADYIVANYPAYRRQQLANLYRTAA